MNMWQYVVMLTLGLVCVGLSVASVALSVGTHRVRADVSARQAQLHDGILGQQGQQIRGGILQDMAAGAAHNAKMRALLERQGYTLPPPPGAATNAPVTTARGRSPSTGGTP